MNESYIPKEISRKILMTGVYYKDNHPGGISSVVRYWSEYFESLQYYPTFKEGSILEKTMVFAKSIWNIQKRLRSDKEISILHAHTAAGFDFLRTSIVVRMAKRNGLKIIIHSHASSFKDFYSSLSKRGKTKVLKTLNLADILIVLSESWKEYFIRIGVPTDRIVILHNIAPYPTFIHIDKDEDKLRLLFLGEIGQRKGVFDLLRAVSKHKDELESKIEIHIGGNKMEAVLKAMIDDNGLSNFVHFDGFVTGDDKIRLLNWANVYILPSFNEGLPISILEAMSYKMPIISTPVGGIPEVVNGDNGILISPGSEDEIYSAIKVYSDNPSLISIQGEESYKKAKTYMPDYVMSHLESIYETLLRN